MTLNSLSIVGGSRWARQIALTLNSLLSAETQITLHSQHNSDNIQDWIKHNNLNRVNVVNTYPFHFDSIKPFALIVVNESRKHFPIAIQSLSCGIPTFVEKPISLAAYDAEQLLNTASRFNTPLCASNVFMFAEYLIEFFRSLKNTGEINEVDIVWCDKRDESRYGEVKKFDASITVLHDVMPHIVSLIKMLLPEKLKLNNLHIFRGGAETDLQLSTNQVNINVKIARNSRKRVRKVRVNNTTGIFELDFSDESNMFITNFASRNVQKISLTPDGALHNMMKAFLNVVQKKQNDFDSRLSPVIALEACQLCDISIKQYKKLQLEWLASEKNTACTDDLNYAVRELVSS